MFMKAVKAVSILLPFAMAAAAPLAQAQSGDLYYELQLLRDEIRQMSGRIEELDHELGRLKQRQQEDYRDLDRRISPDPEAGLAPTGQGAAGNAPALIMPPAENAAPAVSAGSTPQDTPSSAGQLPQPESRQDLSSAAGVPLVVAEDSDAPIADLRADREQYEAAYDLLRRRRMDDAAEAFQTYVDQYPQGRFVANAYYWLGEIYLLQNKLDEAEQAFVTVKDNFSGDQKAEDAAYKLGRVYHLQGEDTRAKAVLESVAAGMSNTAQLARDYLRENF